MYQQIIFLMEKACYYCNEYSTKSFATIPCGCRMCKECFLKKLKQVTGDKFFLNDYEKCKRVLI